MTDKRDSVRKKLLGLLPRHQLEHLSELESPWHANREDLVKHVLAKWPHDNVAEAINKLLEKAK